MKNAHIIFKPIIRLLFLICNLWAIPSSGQNIIYNHPASNSESSLIRYYKDSVDIRVEQWTIDPSSGNTARSCNYVNRATGDVYTFYFPSHYGIGDFEIFDGNVYFCGENGTNAYWGYFNIDSVFFLGGNVHYVLLSNSATSHIMGLNRLDVFEESGTIHIVMLGVGTTLSNTGSAVAEAWKPSGSGWKFWYSIESDCIVTYRDIAVTDNYVVIVGHSCPNGASPLKHWLLHYNRPTAATSNLSIFEIMGGSIWGTPAYIPVHLTNDFIFSPQNANMFIAKTQGDGFSTVCTESGGYCVVSMYSNPTVNPYERFKFIDGNSFMSEIAYNSHATTLCLVKGWNVVYNIGTTLPTIEKVTTDMYHWISIDDIPSTNLFTISGAEWDFSMAKQWLFDVNNPNNCISRESVNTYDLPKEQVEGMLQQNISNDFITWSHYSTRIFRSRIVVKCH